MKKVKNYDYDKWTTVPRNHNLSFHHLKKFKYEKQMRIKSNYYNNDGGEKSFNEIIGTNVRAIILRSIFMLAKEK